jgi:hypothetical protein
MPEPILAESNRGIRNSRTAASRGSKSICEAQKSAINGWCRALAILLAFLQAYPLAAMQNTPSPSLSPVAQKIKAEVSRIPIDGKLTVRKIDGTEYHGRLQAIEPEQFSIREVDLKTTVTIPYDEVEQVRKNYGGKGAGGQRVNPKKNLIVAAVTLGVLFTILIVALAKDKS